jgi:hypothetical protein
MHLYGRTLERYASRTLPAEDLTAIDLHVSNCMFCAGAFAEAQAATADWERRGWLGRLVRVAPQEPVAETGEDELEARAA